jgi:hypothetical protein
MSSGDSVNEKVDFAGIQALRSRSAGYAVAQKCLEVQAAAEKLDPTLRTPTSVTLSDDAWSWYQGALGEIEVGELLLALGPEWFVRHAIPIGAATKDVDHLVIGPGGVFAINTKHHSGASIWVGDHVVKVNGGNQWYLQAGRGDGLDVAKRLSTKAGFPVRVYPVVAFLNARSILDKRVEAREVTVIDARSLAAWILSQPRWLDEARLGLITLAAEEPETWHIDPHAADTLRVMQRFERLVAEVGSQQPTLTRTGPAVARSPRRAPVARTGRTGRPPATRTRQPASRTLPARAKSSRRSAPISVRKLWATVILTIMAVSILGVVSSERCDSVAVCVVPNLVSAFMPLLSFAEIVAIGVGIVSTIVWGVRRLSRG